MVEMDVVIESRNKNYFRSSRFRVISNDSLENSEYQSDKIKNSTFSKSSLINANDIDEIRRENAAYEYLCHLEEARLWIQECIQENLPHSTELEARLTNGVYFAKIGNFIAPHVVPLKRIFDTNQNIYDKSGLHYRHTDNINHWILAMKAIGLPSYFYPNSFDVYSKKNMPKAVYCLHALSLYLHRCGKGMKIIDLIGKMQFSFEEINSVSHEFKKFGIQLPAFSKISGILANEILPNDATMHAAIIAINIAICQQNCDHFFTALMNPNAQLQNVYKSNAEGYQKALLELKSKTALDMKIKSKNKYEQHWDFLTYEVIQEEINSVNINVILNDLKEAALHCQMNNFINILHHPLLSISEIIAENASIYMSSYKDALKDSKCTYLSVSEVQSLVSVINYNEFKNHEIKFALIHFNEILTSDNYFESFNILKSLPIGIHLHDLGRQFYHVQFKNIKRLAGRFLDLHDIQTNLPVLTALLDISLAIIQCNEDNTFKALSNSVIKCWELHENLKMEYYVSLKKLKSDLDSDFLSVEQIKNCISDTNTSSKLKESSTNSTKNINIAISSKDVQLLNNSLLEDPALLCVDSKHIDLYMSLLSEYKCNKSNCDILSREDIQCQIILANKLILEAEYFCACLASVNIAVDKEESLSLFNSLKTLTSDDMLCSGCQEKYINKLTAIKKKKLDQYSLDKDMRCSSWIKWDIHSQAIFYLNLKTLETAWNQEHEYSLFISKTEILEVIAEVKNECHCVIYEIAKFFVTSLQARIRGFLVRQNFSKKGVGMAHYTPLHINAALKLQSFVRMSFVRKKFLKKKSEKIRLHTAARVIQRQWRAFKINQSFNILAHSSNPDLSLMQKIIYMLEISNDDYSEEFKYHTIKGKAVQTIRYNQSLLKEIDEMDVKIGLLIRNRITLEDLLKQKKRASMKIKRSENLVKDIKYQGSKLFTKRYNSVIKSFENLLYLLQTKPIYLSRLIITLPSNQRTTLIESILFSLYNFGSTPREEYLLLKMLSLTLEEDIKQRDYLSDIIKGENLIMKIIISFYRKNYWKGFLKTLLQPLILEVLNDKSTLCNIDPIEIYKIWQNEIEMQTGVKSSMPHEVTVEEALNHVEVNSRFDIYLENFLTYSLKFCEAIINGQELIPYGMMYVSKILKTSLQKKYPLSSTEEINKIVGNFLYYRFINPAIIAPDVLDIIPTQHNEQLADCDRLKLSTIAKFLHVSVSGKKYTDDTGHLMYLNPYITDCHEKLLLFFDDVCNVKELEEQFNIDIFSEAIVQIPEVYMSLSELYTLYKLLCEKEHDIALDSNDMLRDIIKDLSLNSVDEICNSSDDFLNAEICLSLKSKYDLEVDDETDDEKLYIETKFILITLLRVFLNVNHVADIFQREPTFEEEMEFEKICLMKHRDVDISRYSIKSSGKWKTLSDLQSSLHHNLNLLESSGFVSSSNNYQDILNDIAKDIVNRWKYRISRKREIFKLLEIQKQLDRKTISYLEKLEYYNNYIAACLENMKIGRKKFFFSRNSSSNEIKCKNTVKCSGAKLHDKGILLEIKDLDFSQLKNANFEISPAEDLGIFTVKAKFLGFPIETVDIDIQELLDMQYRGIAEMNILERVKINNNLLLHFLNNKFYGKCML